MKITLDKQAMRKLIEDDPEFEVQLKAAVLAEIGKKSVGMNMQKLIEESAGPMFRGALAELAKEESIRRAVEEGVESRVKHNINTRSAKMSHPDTGEEVTVDDAIQSIVDRRINEQITTAIEARDQVISRKLDDRLRDKLLDVKIENAIESAIVDRADRIIKERFSEWFNVNVADMISRAKVSV